MLRRACKTSLTVRRTALHVFRDIERHRSQYLDGGEQIRLRAAKLAAPVANVARVGDVDLRIEGLRGELLHVGSMISVRASRIVPRLRRNGRAGADERRHALQSRYVVHTKFSVGAP